jgi:hypothetical protein
MSVEGPERFTGGCLCGSVRIVVSGGRTASACATVSTAESITALSFMPLRSSRRMP